MVWYDVVISQGYGKDGISEMCVWLIGLGVRFLMSRLRRILRSFLMLMLSVFRRLQLFCTWDRFDSPEAVVEEWRDSLNDNVSESLGSILLRHDSVLHK